MSQLISKLNEILVAMWLGIKYVMIDLYLYPVALFWVTWFIVGAHTK
jgi:hypothetical protein